MTEACRVGPPVPGRRRRPGHTSNFKIHSNPHFTHDRRRQANKISRVNWQSMQAASASACTDHAAELRNWFVDHFYCGVASSMPPLSDATLQSADALELLQRVRAMHQGRLRERALLTADAQSRARLYAFEGNSIFVSQQSIGQRRTYSNFEQYLLLTCLCSASPATAKRGNGHHCRALIARRTYLAFYSRGDRARARPTRRSTRQLPGRSESADAVHCLCS